MLATHPDTAWSSDKTCSLLKQPSEGAGGQDEIRRCGLDSIYVTAPAGYGPVGLKTLIF